MKNRKPLISVLVAVIALIGLAVFLSLPPDEPIVEGHPLSYWLGQVKLYDTDLSSLACQEALGSMDDRCVRALADELNWKPSYLITKVNRVSKWLTNNRLSFHERPDRSAAAAWMLGQLGERARNAIPVLEQVSRAQAGDGITRSELREEAVAALILIRHDSPDACARKLLENSSSDRFLYQHVMVRLGTNAAPCIPILVAGIETGTNEDIKFLAACALCAIHSQPELSVPPLISMLKEPNPKSRSIAVFALGEFRMAAKPAWKDLVKCLNDPEEKVRIWATNALCEIDSEAASRLGLSKLAPID